ncbi:MAG: shikimate dehydrogenase [Sideroxydans sp.]|nr:shikimate dehydrogenase [Sideroxydans sp.]
MTDRYAVIGNPINHSKSPLIHQMFAAQTGEDMSYEKIAAPLDGFAATIQRLRNEGYKGCNVTVPFKFEAFELASEKQPRAVTARAANTLVFAAEQIIADNTDGAGLVRDIEQNLNVSLRGKRVLLMGAGGAAYGVALPLLMTGCALSVVNRTVVKAQQLAANFAPHGNIKAYAYEDLTGLPFDVIINATSSGLSDELAPLPASFAPHALAYDMMYGRATPFMQFAKQHGAQVADGLGMLVEQAAEAFFIWRGVRPATAPVIAALRAR